MIAVSHQRSEVLAVTNIIFIFLSEEYIPSTGNFRLALSGSPSSQCATPGNSQCATPGNNAQPDGCQRAKILDGGAAECMALYFETANSRGLPTAPKNTCGHNLLHLNSLAAALGECLEKHNADTTLNGHVECTAERRLFRTAWEFLKHTNT